MRFNEALTLMKQGKRAKLPSWGGYWAWDEEKQTILMHCRPGNSDTGKEVLDIRETQQVEYTMMNICSDEWVVADETNTPILGGVATFNFGEAIKYLKRGLRVARQGWNGKGIYLEIQRPDEHSKMTLPYIYIVTNGLVTDNPKAPKGIVPWLASQTDMLAEDWTFFE